MVCWDRGKVPLRAVFLSCEYWPWGRLQPFPDGGMRALAGVLFWDDFPGAEYPGTGGTADFRGLVRMCKAPETGKRLAILGSEGAFQRDVL